MCWIFLPLLAILTVKLIAQLFHHQIIYNNNHQCQKYAFVVFEEQKSPLWDCFYCETVSTKEARMTESHSRDHQVGDHACLESPLSILTFFPRMGQPSVPPDMALAPQGTLHRHRRGAGTYQHHPPGWLWSGFRKSEEQPAWPFLNVSETRRSSGSSRCKKRGLSHLTHGLPSPKLERKCNSQ